MKTNLRLIQHEWKQLSREMDRRQHLHLILPRRRLNTQPSNFNRDDENGNELFRSASSLPEPEFQVERKSVYRQKKTKKVYSNKQRQLPPFIPCSNENLLQLTHTRKFNQSTINPFAVSYKGRSCRIVKLSGQLAITRGGTGRRWPWLWCC